MKRKGRKIIIRVRLSNDTATNMIFWDFWTVKESLDLLAPKLNLTAKLLMYKNCVLMEDERALGSFFPVINLTQIAD